MMPKPVQQAPTSTRFLWVGRMHCNVADIRRFRRTKTYSGEGVVEFFNGEKFTLSEPQAETFETELTNLHCTLIPAEPGYILLSYYDDNAPERLPILAWLINPNDEEYGVRPVTRDGVLEEFSISAVQPPDNGRLYAWHKEWATEDDWRADMKRQQEERAAREAQRAKKQASASV